MKIFETAVRSLMGSLFVFSALAYFFKLFPEPELQGGMKILNEGFKAVGYFMPLLKSTELVCGVLLLLGRMVPLALVVLAPIVVNIILIHIFLEPSGIPVAIFLFLCMSFLGYRKQDSFASLFK